MFKALKAVHKNKEGGFSLVELMIVVGIIGVLATLAVPRFQQFQAKARMAEAKNMLNHLFTLQEAYHLDNNTYLDFTVYGRNPQTGVLNCSARPANAAALGFEINPCPANNQGPVPRYGYSVPNASVTASTFTGDAATGGTNNNKVCPGKAQHTWHINQAREMWVNNTAPGATQPNPCQ